MPAPIIVFFLQAAAVIVVISIVRGKIARRRAQEAKKRSDEYFPGTASGTRTAPAAAPARPAPTPAQQAAEAARQQELKRRLAENAERRRLERESLEKRPAERPQVRQQNQRPIVAHSEDDCGGGSIHDGYHEGVTQFQNGRPAAVAGRLGHDLADEDEKLARDRASADNARRVMERIGKLPPLSQGMVYAEILGKPKSELS